MTCSKCPTRITWRRHVRTGKAAPIEIQPVPNGNIRLIDEKLYEVVTELNPPRPGERLFVNHYVTCEFSKSFRKKKESSI